MSYVIRDANESDATVMCLVLERANAMRDGSPLPEEVADFEKLTEIRARMGNPRAWCRVVLDGSALAGFVLGHPSAFEDTIETEAGTHYLALLMIDPGHWGNGLATKLLMDDARGATERGMSRIMLWTAESNARARALYERNGYKLTKATRVSKRQGPLVQYQLDLGAEYLKQ